MQIKSERLIIEDMLPFDFRELSSILFEQEVAEGIGYNKPICTKDCGEVFANYMKSPYFFKIIHDGYIIGFIEFHKDYTRSLRESLRIDFAIKESERNKGYMTEAVKATVRCMLEVRELPVISIGHYPSNLRSKKVIEKSGFKLEGTIRNAKRLENGEIVDVVNYSIIKEDLE